MIATQRSYKLRFAGERAMATVFRRCCSILVLAVLCFVLFYLLMMTSASLADQRAIHLYAFGQDARPYILFALTRTLIILACLFGAVLFLLRMIENIEALTRVFDKYQKDAA